MRINNNPAKAKLPLEKPKLKEPNKNNINLIPKEKDICTSYGLLKKKDEKVR
jgi:hypothetical protein